MAAAAEADFILSDSLATRMALMRLVSTSLRRLSSSVRTWRSSFLRLAAAASAGEVPATRFSIFLMRAGAPPRGPVPGDGADCANAEGAVALPWTVGVNTDGETTGGLLMAPAGIGGAPPYDDTGTAGWHLAKSSGIW